MQAPDRSSEVSEFVAMFGPEVFRSRKGVNPDEIRAEAIPMLCGVLNKIEGRKVWGGLRKALGQNIKHDIIVWKDTMEHFDVFTGAEKVENTKPTWTAHGPTTLQSSQWMWVEFEDVFLPELPTTPPTPTPTPTPLPPSGVNLEPYIKRIAVLEYYCTQNDINIEELRNALMKLDKREGFVKGNTNREWSHGHVVNLPVQWKEPV